MRAYLKEVRDAMHSALAPARDRFPSVRRLLHLLDRREELALQDKAYFRQFNEVHNEACTAVELLKAPTVESLEYEPSILQTKKRLDFQVAFRGGKQGWVEVKTINPDDKDDWDKYDAALKAGRFPRNVNLILDEEWMGGEIYHDGYTSRTKILDYTIETESRIAACAIDPVATPCTLVIAATPLKLSLDAVEDFATFYRFGRHTIWDEWRDMERHALEERGAQLARTIASFGYVGRATFEVWPREVAWKLPSPVTVTDLR